MFSINERPVSPTYMGFQKWIKLPVDDFPLIQPPKQHMLAHVTGGLNELYKVISDDKVKRQGKVLLDGEESELHKDGQGKAEMEDKSDIKNGIAESTPVPQKSEAQKLKAESEPKEEKEMNDIDKEKSEAKKRDDEGGGQAYIGDDLEDEETSPYTDEEGEFAPEDGIPLLASRYKFVEVLARGQSALIVKALDTFAKERAVAIKVLHRIYKPIGSQEADILLELHRADPWLHVPFARLQNQFIYGPHYCLVFDFLSPTPLYNHYDKKNIRGPTSLSHVRNLCVKLLTVMGFLHKQNVIHADLKPENILLMNEEDMSSVMVIDFGNALRNTEEELSLYYTDFELQTLLYRAPEVIFGLKFSLEIDMWSLGCLLAECYTGEPLFMGKTKEDILAKITRLLGPFPNEFHEGECADLFSEFIGRPLTRYQRVENLRKRLNNCQDINFLLLLERLLTYLPAKRISPFEAACHPFIASVNPFLYLSSSNNLKRYPTVVLDMSTYPYFPGLPDDSMMDQTSLDGRKRLASYSRSADSAPVSMPMPMPVPVSVPVSMPIATPKVEKEQVVVDKPLDKPALLAEQQEPSENEVNNIADETSMSLSQPSSPQPPPSVNSQPKSVSPTRPPSTPPVPISPAAQPSGAKSPSSVKSPVPILAPSPQAKPSEKRPPSRTKEEATQQTKSHGAVDLGDNFSRTDVKQTLKSMGLRCEDFTISVYSREQAHAILRKQGVEVTNHQPAKVPGTQPAPSQPSTSPAPAPTPTPTPAPSQPQSPGQQQNQQPPPPPPPQQQQPQSKQPARPPSKPGKANPTSGTNIRPSVSVLRSEPTPRPQPAPPPPKSSKVDDDDDDDDCVILDPPEGPKPPNRFPHQFQLMGTTVQVNRGSKRQMRSMSHAPMPKRIHASRSYYYNEGYPYEESPEASVQDTLKRLKNYNISITCRRNSAQRHPRMHTMDSDSSDMDHDGSHLDSEDEEDMAKYLECEIDEEKELGLDTEGDEMLDLDSSGSINDISPERVERRIAKPKKRRAENESDNVEGLNSTVEIEDEEKDSENVLSDSQKGQEREDASGFDRDNGPLDKMEDKCQKESKIDNEDDHLANTDEPRTTSKTGKTEDDQEESAAISDWERNRGGEGEDINTSQQELSRKDVQEGVENPGVDCEVDAPSTKVSEDHRDKTDLSVKNQPTKETTDTLSPTEQQTSAKANNSTSERKGFDSSVPARKRQSSRLFTNWSSEDELFESLIPKKDKKVRGKRTDDIFEPIDLPAGRDMCANLDDDINEELEKQLLEAGNLDDDDFEGDEMDGEGLDHLDLENEL